MGNFNDNNQAVLFPKGVRLLGNELSRFHTTLKSVTYRHFCVLGDMNE